MKPSAPTVHDMPNIPPPPEKRAGKQTAAKLNVQTLNLADLKPHPANPRVHPSPGSTEWEGLKRSLASDYFDPIVFNRRNGLLVSGHLRTKVLLESGYKTADCVVVDYDEPTHTARMIAANKPIGKDDAAALKDLLQELDTGAMDMSLTGFTEAEIEQLMTQVHQEDDQTYTNKIVSPVYTPKGERPKVSELFDRKKTDELIAGIAAANLPADVASFMRIAAERHTVFNFRQIAEFYCHADPVLQDLMERSGMVIIDFNKAIEYGFVSLTEKLGELADLEDEGDDENDSIITKVGGTQFDSIAMIEEACKDCGIDTVAARDAIIKWDQNGPLFKRWYAGIDTGKPDYGIYDDILYIGEAFGCWRDYSKETISKISKPTKVLKAGLLSVMGDINHIIDVGCGLGLTTAALKKLFPLANVIGTNVKDSYQWKIAEYISKRFGFTMQDELPSVNGRSMIFASEYFEHFLDPIKELERLLGIKPSFLICANTFGNPGAGHFPQYSLGGRKADGRKTSREFGDVMRRSGYKKIDTGFWNSRPTVWGNANA